MKTILWSRYLWVVAAALAILVVPPARATSFDVLLGDADVSEGCQEVSIATRFADAPEVLRSRPGVGLQITIKIKREYSGDKTFSKWRNNVMMGTTDRRSMTIKFLTDNHTARLREFNLFDCSPEELLQELTADGTIQSETLTVTAARIEFASDAAGSFPPQGNVSAVFDQQGQLEPWNSWGGGEPALILKSFMNGTKYHEDSPDNTIVTPLTLTGSAATPRPALFQWLNDAVNGKPWRDSLSIAEISGRRKLGRSFVYNGCAPRSYSITGFDSKSSSHLVETIEIVGERIHYA